MARQTSDQTLVSALQQLGLRIRCTGNLTWGGMAGRCRGRRSGSRGGLVRARVPTKQIFHLVCLLMPTLWVHPRVSFPPKPRARSRRPLVHHLVAHPRSASRARSSGAPGLPRDQFSGPWLFSTAEARTSNSSSSPGLRARWLMGRWPLVSTKSPQARRGQLPRPRRIRAPRHARTVETFLLLPGSCSSS